MALNGCSSALLLDMPSEIEGKAQHYMLFSYIFQATRNVSIGALEHCGDAHAVRIGSSDV
jgi:hypothetical protein